MEAPERNILLGCTVATPTFVHDGQRGYPASALLAPARRVGRPRPLLTEMRADLDHSSTAKTQAPQSPQHRAQAIDDLRVRAGRKHYRSTVESAIRMLVADTR
jgi:hypothetical protein